MRLADLVSTSRRVAETRSRSEKTGALADLLRRLSPEEIDVAVAWLSGNLRQGRIGLGGAAIRDARPGTAAAEPALTLGEVDATFERIAATTGAGSTAARVGMLGELLARATREEQETLQALPARQLILDGEVIALRPDGAPLPFQVTMRRFGRKLDVARLRGELPLTPFFFDVLHLDGEDLLDRPAGERFAALGAAVPGLTVPRLVTADAEAADAFFADALQRGHEGMMAKALDAPYEAGRRGFSWLKIKPAHTLDPVVLAAEWRPGRRQRWLSDPQPGARDAENGGFVMLGKTFKGMTDETLAWQ